MLINEKRKESIKLNLFNVIVLYCFFNLFECFQTISRTGRILHFLDKKNRFFFYEILEDNNIIGVCCITQLSISTYQIKLIGLINNYYESGKVKKIIDAIETYLQQRGCLKILYLSDAEGINKILEENHYIRVKNYYNDIFMLDL